MILWVVSIAGLLPWGIAAIITNWFNEYDSGCHCQTLSVPHALLLLMLQMTIGLSVFVVGEWLKR